MSRAYSGLAALGGLWGIASAFLLNSENALKISAGATGAVVLIAALWSALTSDQDLH